MVIGCRYNLLVGVFCFGLLLVRLDDVGPYRALDLVDLFFAEVFLDPDFFLMHF